MITETPELTQDWYVVNDTTIRTVDTEFEVEAGDAEQLDFYPQIKLKRWLNEFNFSIRPILPDYTVDELRTINGMVYARIGQVAFGFWVGTDETEDGAQQTRGVRFEIVLLSAPGRNYLDFSVNRKGVVLWHQPPLTQAEIDAGFIRPVNVVNSIAIYCSKKHNQYKTGKLCHLYRPRLIDANDNRGWGDWSVIDQSTIRLTIPQDIINNAVYPLRVR